MSLWVEEQYADGHEAQSISEMARQLDRWEPTILIAEDFRGGYAHVNSRDPLLCLGALMLWAKLRGVDLHLQSPSILRTRLPLVGDVHPSKHVRCAAAHVLHYLRKVERGLG